MANIKGQITYAINNCFSEKTDKHAYKSENGKEMDNKIFSFSEKFRLKDVAENLHNYLKENYEDIKQVKDIQPSVIQNFLNSKTNCTQNSVNGYATSLYKIENILNKTYKNCNLNWREEVSVPSVAIKKSESRGVTSVMAREDYATILNACKNSPSQSGYAIRLQDFLGVRVSELSNLKLENIDLKKQTIIIYGKGGRALERAIPDDKIELVKEIIEQKFDKYKLLNVKADSINRFLGRLEEKLGLEKHSNHDIRRLIAQEKYDKYREQGKTIKEAAKLTGRWLSHGDNRNDMLERSYIILR